MNVPSSLRVKPLAACLAAALAIAPVAALLAEPLQPVGHSPGAKRSFAAQLIAASAEGRGPTLTEVMRDAVARARESHLPPSRPAGVTPVTSCDDAGPGTLRDAFTNAVSGDIIDLSALSCGTITLATPTISPSKAPARGRSLPTLAFCPACSPPTAAAR